VKLTKHFWLAELCKSQTAERRGIDNTPSGDAVLKLREVCERVLEPVRAQFGVPIIPSSGFRCAELNRAIGGSDKSQHVSGEAVDFEVAGVSNIEVCRWIADNLTFDQLILECYDAKAGPNSGWVHASWVEWPDARGQVLTYQRKSGYTAGLVG